MDAKIKGLVVMYCAYYITSGLIFNKMRYEPKKILTCQSIRYFVIPCEMHQILQFFFSYLLCKNNEMLKVFHVTNETKNKNRNGDGNTSVEKCTLLQNMKMNVRLIGPKQH